MRAYINDDGQPTIEIPRLVEQPKLVSINTIVDDIVARTEPPKRYQKLVLERSLIGILHAFEIYIAKMLVEDGWCNGDSEFVDVKDVWSDTHTVRHIDKDGTLCIGGCDGKGRKFVNKLKRNGWIDSFIACYDGADHPEIRVFFLPAGIPPKLKVLDWWDSNKVKFKQGLVALSNSRPFEMAEKSIFWWLRNRLRLLLCLAGLSGLIITMLATLVGLAFGMILLPAAANSTFIFTLLLCLFGGFWQKFWRPLWRKITAETPIGWGNGTIHDGTDDEKFRAFRKKAEQEWGIA